MFPLILVCLLFLSACDPNPFLLVVDRDEDGVAFEQDCDDTDPLIGVLIWYRDEDGDGFGAGPQITHCDEVDGHAPTADDCDDSDPAIHPDALEVCDQIDNDCDRSVDQNADDATLWYADMDEDGYGDPDTSMLSCTQPVDHVADNTDCDDTDADISPEAEEYCEDEIDNNCNGTIDDDAPYLTYYRDADGDLFGSPYHSVSSCLVPDGYVTDNTDCDDSESSVHPGTEEICNDWLDNNCNESVDDCVLEGDLSFSRADLVISGDADGQFVGSVVLADGDYNNDGHLDLFVSSTGDHGSVSVFLGPHLATGELMLSEADTVFTGVSSGDAVGSACDVRFDADEDGFDDLLIGAPYLDGATSDTGAAYLVLSTEIGSVSLVDSALTFMGTETMTRAGQSVQFVEHGDDDGLIDVAVGADDAVAVILNPTLRRGTISLESADTLLSGDTTEEIGGAMVSLSLDGDGYTDLVIGAPGANEDAGGFYTVSGPLSLGMVSLADAGDFVPGEQTGGRAGENVFPAGDIDLDGYDDLLVSAPLVDGTASDQGATYVVLGPLMDIANLSESHTIVLGESQDDQSGTSASASGDVNQDGDLDYLFSASSSDLVGGDSGASYLFYGPLSGRLTLSDADARFAGVSTSDLAGTSVVIASDLNEDGYDDLLMSAPGTASQSGTVSLFSGVGY